MTGSERERFIMALDSLGIGTFGMTATEEPGRVTMTNTNAGLSSFGYVPAGGGGGSGTAINFVPGEAGRPVYVPDLPPTRLREAAPSLYGLRQAFLDAEGRVAAYEALDAFQDALAKVETPAELDTLTAVTRAPCPPLTGAGLVPSFAVLALVFWAGLAAALVTGSVVLAALTFSLPFAAGGASALRARRAAPPPPPPPG